jgi:hypothetical protein
MGRNCKVISRAAEVYSACEDFSAVAILLIAVEQCFANTAVPDHFVPQMTVDSLGSFTPKHNALFADRRRESPMGRLSRMLQSTSGSRNSGRYRLEQSSPNQCAIGNGSLELEAPSLGAGVNGQSFNKMHS